MRDFLTGLAILAIAVLATALAGPYFVDWTAHRGAIEEKVAVAIGAPVSIAGPISVRLLPSPRLDVQDVTLNRSASGSGTGPVVTMGRLAVEVAVMPLLRGEVRVVEAFLDQPRFEASLSASGDVVGLSDFASALDSVQAVAVERLVVRDGVLSLKDEMTGRLSLISDIDGEADAQALVGPWRANARALVGSTPVDLRVATGAPEPQGARLKLVIQALNGHQRGEIDGRIAVDGSGAHAFDGRLLAGGRLRWPDRDGFSQKPWTFSAALRLNGRTGQLSQAELEAGGEEIPAKFSGDGQLDLGVTPRLKLALEAKQIDLDKPFTLQGRTAPPPAEVLGAWINAFGLDEGGLSPPLPIAATVKAGSLLFGGDVVTGANADIVVNGPAIVIERLQAGLPGGSDAQLSGRAELANGGRFEGHVRVASKDGSRLLGWAEAERSGRSGRLGDAKDVGVEADVSLSPTVMAARGLKLRVERSNLQGAVRYTPPEASARGLFEAQLTSDGLAIEQAPDVSTLSAAAQGVDVAVTLNARNVRVGQAKGPSVGAGRLGVKLSMTRAGLTIDTLEIADVGGASVTASGQVGEKGGKLEAVVDARRVEPLAELLRKVAPGRFPGLLASRAAALSPLKLKLTAFRSAGATGPTTVSVDGLAAGSRLSGSALLGGGQSADKVTASLKLDAPESGPFLRQLGFDALALSGFGAGRLAIDVDGRFGGGATLKVAASAAGASLSGEGRIGQTAQDPDVTGRFTLSAADAGPLMQLLAAPGPDVLSRLPVEARAEVSTADGRWTFADLSGTVAAQPFAGRLAVDLEKDTLDGALTLDRISAATVLGLALGPTQPPIAGAVWSSSRFASVLPPPFATTIAVKGKALDLGDGGVAADPSFTMRWTAENLELAKLDGGYRGGRLGGGLTIRRQGGLANLGGKLTLTGVSLPALFPDAQMAGTVDAEFDGAAAGETASALASSLAGGGRLQIRSMVIPKLDPQALPATAQALDAESSYPDVQRVGGALKAALERSGLIVPTLDAPVTITGGVVRAGPVMVEGQTSLQGAATFDLKTGRFDGRANMTAQAPAGWLGPAPQAGVVWRKTRTGPAEREFDVSLLTNTLTTHAVTRELERMEALEADLRERSFFVRRLKADRDRLERERREAEEAKAAEEARIAEEARKAEEARLVAEARRVAEQRAQEHRLQMQRAEEERLRQQAQEDASRIVAEDARRAEEARAAEQARQADASAKTLGDDDPNGAAEAAHILGRAAPSAAIVPLPPPPPPPSIPAGSPGQPAAP
ncbi:AsmA-like C-terminal region-containing protein [Alsobacter sp. KACC 23698]|uniref:AsmA-like C-terminal region-containing protein n=1 Tax=Alsobacter sp. KACC 23698 TaxID=3149229 RepID=A0AAU7JAU3_9HYPH